MILVALFLANTRPIGRLTGQEAPQTSLLLTKCWESTSEDSVKYISASDNGLYFILIRPSGKVDLVETKTGKRVWRSEFGGEIVSLAIADSDSVFILTNSLAENGESPATTLRAISAVTGIVLWTMPLPYSEESYLAEAGDSLLVLNPDGSIFAQKKSDGSLIWRSTTGARLSGSPRVNGNEVLLPLQSAEISILSTLNGSTNLRIKTDQVPSAVLRVDEKTMIWGDSKGNISTIDSPSGATRWKFKNGGAVSGIITTKRGTLVTSHDNFVYLMTPGGRVIWKRRLSGRVISEPVATDSFAMVTILGEAGVSFIDLESGKILNKIIDGDENGVIGPVKIGNSLIFASPDGVFSYTSAECGTK